MSLATNEIIKKAIFKYSSLNVNDKQFTVHDLEN